MAANLVFLLLFLQNLQKIWRKVWQQTKGSCSTEHSSRCLDLSQTIAKDIKSLLLSFV